MIQLWLMSVGIGFIVGIPICLGYLGWFLYQNFKS